MFEQKKKKKKSVTLNVTISIIPNPSIIRRYNLRMTALAELVLVIKWSAKTANVFLHEFLHSYFFFVLSLKKIGMGQ